MKRSHRIGAAGLAIAVGLLCYASASQAAPSKPSPAQPHPHALPAFTSPAAAQDVYTPLTPCRIVDTRAAGGKLGSDQGRAFYAAGATGFSGQGGHSGGCGVPLDSDAVTISVTATDASANGRLVAYPYGTTAPGSTTLSYLKSANMTASSTAKLAAGTGKQLAIHNYGASTHIVVDVTGYYSKQIQAVLNYNGGIYTGSPTVLSSTQTGTGTYRVAVNRDLSGCTPIASVYGGPYFATATVSGSNVYATTYNVAGTPTNLYWSLVVDC